AAIFDREAVLGFAGLPAVERLAVEQFDPLARLVLSLICGSLIGAGCSRHKHGAQCERQNAHPSFHGPIPKKSIHQHAYGNDPPVYSALPHKSSDHRGGHYMSGLNRWAAASPNCFRYDRLCKSSCVTSRLCCRSRENWSKRRWANRLLRERQLASK